MINQTSFAQCCAAGNPDSDDAFNSGGGKNVLTASTLYKYSYSDTYFEGTKALDYQYIDFSSFNYMSISLSYGISDRLKLSSDIGYFFAKAQTFIPTSWDDKPYREASGLGDASVTAIYQLYKTKKNHFEFFPLVKITLPVGQFDQIYNRVLLPIDLQPSSGNFKYAMGLLVNKKFSNDKFSMSAIGSIELSQRIDTDRTNYKYGNLYNISLMGSYKITKNLTAKLQIRNQIRERAMNKDIIVDATGGYVAFVVPQLSYRLYKTWGITAAWEQPIYKNMNGRQLTNKYAYSIKLTKNFNLKKKEDIKAPTLAVISNAPEVILSVDGACGMCKDRIEKVAMQTEGVLSANWDVESHKLSIKYEEGIFDLKNLKKAIAKAGHDTDTIKASNRAYEKLHECCKYRD